MELSCPCGASGIAITGEPRFHLYCHCKDCQTALGLPYYAVVQYAASAVAATGETEIIVVRELPRVRCAKCHAMLFSDASLVGLRGVHADRLPPGLFQPRMHIHCASAVAPVRDGLPHYKDAPWATNDEQVDW
jgi:hypothetical protein